MTAPGCSTGARCEAPGTSASRASGMPATRVRASAGPVTWSSEPTRTRVGTPIAAEFAAYVEGGERLAGGDVAAGVGGADHLDGPLDDRGLGGGEAVGEPALGRGAGDRVEAVGPDDHAALAELVGGPEPRRGGDQREGGHPVRMAQRQLGADRAADASSPRSRSAGCPARRGWRAAGRRGRRRRRRGGPGHRRGRAGRSGSTRHWRDSSGIWRSHMCQVVPREGPRIRTGASSGPSKRYCRVFSRVSLTRSRSHISQLPL